MFTRFRSPVARLRTATYQYQESTDDTGRTSLPCRIDPADNGKRIIRRSPFIAIGTGVPPVGDTRTSRYLPISSSLTTSAPLSGSTTKESPAAMRRVSPVSLEIAETDPPAATYNVAPS